ncbi:hypothetical protein GMORB2_7061 [Geosmithia morbida]|uniref:Uncharacterized protein n=1 Tax=Geosmithia morbida TaxID=1094350 RepID=A0A9P4YVW9_9HYPO|nr:uncharacterized protein GMORB2_7061 [Geosmithia morbida]KAF4122754.1 hypothetical protein GMORB2_7061 [Geosmithia morbida]
MATPDKTSRQVGEQPTPTTNRLNTQGQNQGANRQADNKPSQDDKNECKQCACNASSTDDSNSITTDSSTGEEIPLTPGRRLRQKAQDVVVTVLVVVMYGLFVLYTLCLYLPLQVRRREAVLGIDPSACQRRLYLLQWVGRVCIVLAFWPAITAMLLAWHVVRWAAGMESLVTTASSEAGGDGGRGYAEAGGLRQGVDDEHHRTSQTTDLEPEMIGGVKIVNVSNNDIDRLSLKISGSRHDKAHKSNTP